MNQKGKHFEDIACEYLVNLGYEILERNFSSKYGEIDIIARYKSILHIVEVKGGKRDLLYKITQTKLNKILKTTDIYLQNQSTETIYQIDALIIEDSTINFIENITL